MLMTALFVITLMSLFVALLSAAIAGGVAKKNAEVVKASNLLTQAMAAAVDAIEATQQSVSVVAAEHKKLNATVASLSRARSADVAFALASIPAEMLPQA
jgi:hypothetical protein